MKRSALRLFISVIYLAGCRSALLLRFLWPLVWLLLFIGWAAPLHAQVPDSTQTAPADSLQPDSLTARPDSLRADSLDTTEADTLLRPPLRFDRRLPGTAIDTVRPARQPALDAPGLLAEVPGSFVFDFGTPGWPDGWSPLALSPQRVGLHLDDQPFDDPVTGRPRYDLLPLAFLHPLHTAPDRYGGPAAVYAQTLPYDRPEPLTELRYRGGALQSIMALHMQRRRRPLFGQNGVLHVVGGYGGHAANGQYPGSQLRRMRQLYGRLQYQQPEWAVEISNLYNRRHLGAHGGVVPQGAFATIYDRFGATVRNTGAERQTIRNDLVLTARARLLPGLLPPPTLAAYWTAQTFRYSLPSDTLAAKTNRYGLRLQQNLRLGAQHLQLRLEGWTDRLRESNALPDTIGLHQTRLHAAVRDSLQLFGMAATLEAQLHASDDLPLVTGAARLARDVGPVRLFAEGRSAGQPVPWVARYGFGRFMSPVETLPVGRVTQARVGLSAQAGSFDATLLGFAHRLTEPLDYYAIEGTPEAQADAVETRVGASFQRVGAGADLGWRRAAERGFYLTAQPTFTRLLNPQQSSLRERLWASVPAFFARGKLGARYALFTGDLDLDVYLQGRFWSRLRSRTLHPPTGLLVLPSEDASAFGPSGTLDVFLEAGVRTATLFIAYENMLSGTPLMPGTLLVPTYPLPAQRFRFGVFWPIGG